MNKPQAELIIRDVDISTLARRRELSAWLKEQADQLNKPKTIRCDLPRFIHEQKEGQMNDIAKKSVLISMADRFGMEAHRFEQVLRATVVPKDCGPEQFAAFLLVAKQYNLNPITKEIYAFPGKGGGIVPIVGVDGWQRIMNDQPSYDGIDLEEVKEGKEVIGVKCTIWRKDRSHPTVITEYMSECLRDTPAWKQWPIRMLRHKAAIQCARYAFGFSGIMEPDEYERGPGASLGSTKSSYQARKDGDWESLMKEMKAFSQPDELRGWWSDNKERIKNLPRNWQTHLDDEFHRILGAMNPEHPLKRPRGRPPKIKEQLKASLEAETIEPTTGEIINDEIPKFEANYDTYLADLESELNVAQTVEDIEIIRSQYESVKDGLFPLDRDKAEDLFTQHGARITG